MLVLSRKVGECVVIGEGIVVQVLEGSGRRIRLGIQAPSGVPIRREELSATRVAGADRTVRVDKPR
jgi:carbon storage regulator